MRVNRRKLTVVPEGRNDGSLAVYCQGQARKKDRPVGYGMMSGAGHCSPANTLRRAGRPITPCPTGRASRYRISRHFMPGYHHPVPTGHPRLRVRFGQRPVTNTPKLHYSVTPLARVRGQPVRRSFRFMLRVGLASEARSTTRTSAKAEERRRGLVRSL